MVAAIEAGFPQREIQNAAYRTQVAMDRGDQEVVGVNVHQDDSSPPTDLLKVDASIGEAQIERLTRFKNGRKQAAVRDALDALTQAATGTDNLMPHIIHAVKSDVTLGEIADGLRAVYGEYQEQVVI